jgi:hypothetical protein
LRFANPYPPKGGFRVTARGEEGGQGKRPKEQGKKLSLFFYNRYKKKDSLLKGNNKFNDV